MLGHCPLEGVLKTWFPISGQRTGYERCSDFRDTEGFGILGPNSRVDGGGDADNAAQYRYEKGRSQTSSHGKVSRILSVLVSGPCGNKEKRGFGISVARGLYVDARN